MRKQNDSSLMYNGIVDGIIGEGGAEMKKDPTATQKSLYPILTYVFNPPC